MSTTSRSLTALSHKVGCERAEEVLPFIPFLCITILP